MSQLILEWLNVQVGLSRKVTTFERDFANGFLYGELLQRHGLVHSIEDNFRDQSSYTSKQDNFKKLQEILRANPQLAVALKDEQVREMMDEDRGSSLRFLFLLRKGLLQAGNPTARPELQKDSSSTRLARQLKGLSEERFYDEKVKNLRGADPRMAYELHHKLFVDEHTKQMQDAAVQEAKMLAEQKQNQDDFRSARNAKMHEIREMKEKEEQAGVMHWQAQARRKYAGIEKDLIFEKQMIERERQRLSQRREHYQKDCGYADGDESGIAWFEKNLQRLGIDTSEHSGSTQAAMAPSSLRELYDQLEEKLPNKVELQIEVSKRMVKIRDAKRITDLARKERERRQRRVQVEQQSTQATVEEQRREEDLLAQMAVEAVEYRRKAAEHDLLLSRKEAEKRERAERQRALSVKAETEHQEASSKTAQRALEERAARLLEKTTAKPDMDATLRDDQKDSDEGEDDEFWMRGLGVSLDETRRLLLSAESLHSASGADELSLLHLPTAAVVASAQELLSCLKSAGISDYIFGRGSWAPFQPSEATTFRLVPECQQFSNEGLEGVAKMARLGSVTKWLCTPERRHPQHPVQLPSELLPLRALVWSPAASLRAQELAAKLCQANGWALIEPQKVVEECIALSKVAPQDPDWPMLSRLRALGKEFQKISQSRSDAAIPPGAYVEMIFRKIELLSCPAPKPVEEEDPDPKKKKAAAKGKVAEEPPEPVRPNGILILGFPSDPGQMAALEAALYGTTSPLLSLLDSEDEKQLRISSALALDSVEDGVCGAIKAAAAEEEERWKASLAAATSQLRVLTLEAADVEETQAAVVKISAEALGAAAPAAAEGALYCRGIDQKLHASSTNAVDANWLWHQSQVFAKALAETSLGLVELRLPASAGAEAAVAEVMERLAAKVATAVLSEAAEGADEATEADPGPAEGMLKVVAALPKAELREKWLCQVTGYLQGLKSTFAEADAEMSSYSNDLIQMQRRYLEFIQRSDEKPQVMDEYLRHSSERMQKGEVLRPDQLKHQIQELSNKLWTITNSRRFEAMEERQRLMRPSSFWEIRVNTLLRAAEKLQALEYSRFLTSVNILATAFGFAEHGPGIEAVEWMSTEGISSEEDIQDWLSSSTRRFASAPIGIETTNFPEELRRAILAERLGMSRRLAAVAAWVTPQLKVLRRQLEEVFSRMDDWITERVRGENDAIKSAAHLLLNWQTQKVQTPDTRRSSLTMVRHSLSSSMTRRMTSQTNLKQLPAGERSRRREALKALEPLTIHVELFYPPKVEVIPSLQGSFPVAARKSSFAQLYVPADRFTQEMLSGLQKQLAVHGAAVCREEDLLQALVERRSSTLGYWSEAIPQSWVKRPEAVLKLLCRSFLEPASGEAARKIDVTEFLLVLSSRELLLPWPSLQSLESCRQQLLSEDSGLSSEARSLYPDIQISEEIFMRMPLWDDRHEVHQKWLWQVLSRFEEDQSAEGDGGRPSGSLSVRRLFGYLGLGDTPTEGLTRLRRLLLPSASLEGSQEVLVQDLWTLLFSQKTRPAAVVAEAPPLSTFCIELTEKAKVPEAEPDKKAPKAAPKAKGKVEAQEEEPPPLLPPEEQTIALDEAALLQRPAVLRALVSHGGLLCRRRGLDVLFPETGSHVVLLSSKEVLDLRPLASVLPQTPS